MLGYGFVKVFPLQFPYPFFYKLTEPFGDFSPMGALWYFMGSSPAYVMFSGSAEVIAGTLLLFRRTALSGALAATAVLTNIVALNLCYDVPVKLYSANLLIMALFLVSGDLGRVRDALLSNRAIDARVPSGIQFPRPWLRLTVRVLAPVYLGWCFFGLIRDDWKMYRDTYIHPDRPPIYGLYDVESFTVNGALRAPLLTDSGQWKKVMLEFPGSFQVRLMDDSLKAWPAAYDKNKKTISLRHTGEYNAARNTVALNSPKDRRPDVLTWSVPDSGHVVIQGELDAHRVSVKLRRVDVSKFLLRSRGFHWINERPFNR
jgi:hypothetical protein